MYRHWILGNIAGLLPSVRLPGVLSKSTDILTIRSHVTGPSIKYFSPKFVIKICRDIEISHIYPGIQLSKEIGLRISTLIVGIGLIITVGGSSASYISIFINLIHIPERVSVLRVYTCPFSHVPGVHFITFHCGIPCSRNDLDRVSIIICRQIGHLVFYRSEEHTSELQSRGHLVCRLLLEKKKTTNKLPI